MPSSDKTRSVTLRVNVADILQAYVGKDRPYQTIHDAVNDIVETHCRLKEVIDQQYDHLSFRAVGPDSFQIKDDVKDPRVEIAVTYDEKVKKYRLYCTVDKTTNCDHIGFALTQPRILEMDDIRKVSRKKK